MEIKPSVAANEDERVDAYLQCQDRIGEMREEEIRRIWMGGRVVTERSLYVLEVYEDGVWNCFRSFGSFGLGF